MSDCFLGSDGIEVCVSNTPLDQPLPDICQAYGICTIGFYNPVAGGGFPVPSPFQPLGPLPSAPPRLPKGPVTPFVPTREPVQSPATVPTVEPPAGELPPGPLEPDIAAAAAGGGEDVPSNILVGTPEYPEPRPLYSETKFFPLPQAPYWLRLLGTLGELVSPLRTAFDLLTYSPEAGLPADVESALVASNLGPARYPITLPPVKTLAFDMPSLLAAGAGLPELTVTGVRPAGATLPLLDPRLASFPLPQPGSLASPLPGLEPGTVTAPQPLTQPRTGLRPGVVAPGGVGLAPRLGKPGVGFTTPLLAVTPQVSPLAQPLPELSNVQCVCTKPKDKKDKKKRRPRTVCYRGVYEDRANGLVKLKQVRIPCR
jgi:hypothetical protein